MPTPKTTLYLDASAFKESACPFRLAQIIVHGIRERRHSPSLSYGTAFHKYRASLRETMDHNVALKVAIAYYLPISVDLDEKEYRTLEHLLQTCTLYHRDVYCNDTFLAVRGAVSKTALLEQKFSFIIYEDDLLQLQLAGTLDEIGMLSNENRYAICDAKTSSNTFNKDAYLKLYRKSTQLMFYKYIVEKCQPSFKGIPCFIDGVFYAPKSRAQFQRSELFEFDDNDMAQFERLLMSTIEIIIKSFHNNKWDKDYRQCDSSKYDVDKVGACKFFSFCSVNDPELSKFMLEKNYTMRKYNPLTFDADNLVKD